MDKLFGGNQGEEDMHRIANIRQELGITEDGVVGIKSEDAGSGHHVEAA